MKAKMIELNQILIKVIVLKLSTTTTIAVIHCCSAFFL